MGSPTLFSTRIVSILTLLLAVAAAVLGYVGFDGYVRGHEDFAGSGPWDLVYYSFQLFVLGPSALVGGDVNAPLQVARFLAPLTTLLAVVQTLALLFGDWATALAVRWRRGHAIVVGDDHAAALLARRLVRAGTPVAVLGGAVGRGEVRRLAVLPGAPTDPRSLHAAGLGRAGVVYAVSSSWVGNAAVALEAGTRAGAATRVYADLPDDDVLLAALRTAPDAAGDRPVPELVSLDSVAARALLLDHPPGPDGDRPRPVVVTGTGSFALAVLRELARSQQPTGRPRDVLVVTAQPHVVDAAALGGLHVETIAPAALADRMPGLASAVVYVCWADPDRVVRDGLAHRPSGSGRVVLCLRRLAGLGAALNGQRVFDAERLAVFGVLDSACRPERIAGDLLDLFARGVHAAYVREETAAGRGGAAQAVPWEELAPGFREDNLHAARRIQDYVATIGGEVVRRSKGLTPFAFTPADVQRLARQEHGRWMAAKAAAGVVHGPERTATTHPDLLEWDQLSPEVRAKDVRFVEAIPEILATGGMQVVRRATPGG